MQIGQKVVCIDGKFPLGIEKLYTALPEEGKTYIIREVSLGVNWKSKEGEVCLYLLGLRNPKSSKAPFPERGFNAERFKPLEEIVKLEENTNLQEVEVEVEKEDLVPI